MRQIGAPIASAFLFSSGPSHYEMVQKKRAISVNMFKAIGFVIVLWALSMYFSDSFTAFDDATTASFKAVEAAAVVSKAQIESIEIQE